MVTLVVIKMFIIPLFRGGFKLRVHKYCSCCVGSRGDRRLQHHRHKLETTEIQCKFRLVRHILETSKHFGGVARALNPQIGTHAPPPPTPPTPSLELSPFTKYWIRTDYCVIKLYYTRARKHSKYASVLQFSVPVWEHVALHIYQLPRQGRLRVLYNHRISCINL